MNQSDCSYGDFEETKNIKTRYNFEQLHNESSRFIKAYLLGTLGKKIR